MEKESIELNQQNNPTVIDNIFHLRHNFMVIGLTGRTGSGCTTVADLLCNSDFKDLKSNHSEFPSQTATNQARKDRIVYEFMKINWHRFEKITASDIIYFYALLLDFDSFIKELALSAKGITDTRNNPDKNKTKAPENTTAKKVEITGIDKIEEEIKNVLQSNKSDFEDLHNRIEAIMQIFSEESEEKIRQQSPEWYEETKRTLLIDLPIFRKKVEETLDSYQKGLVARTLQTWGNEIRKKGSLNSEAEAELQPQMPDAIAKIINNIIKVIRRINKTKQEKTWLVIDALRNPFEILYFRERYSAFYCMSVNTDKKTRHDFLLKEKKLSYDDIKIIDENENNKKEQSRSFSQIDIDKCIELSDIHLTHDDLPINKNKNLINQLFTYLSLILHPGLVSPTPEERIMQIAYTAKMNSGCLSRQVGAAVTGEDYSLRSIGWNSVAEGQVPCTLRKMSDLWNQQDSEAFSYHECNDDDFTFHIQRLKSEYGDDYIKKLKGLPLTYCFKDIHTAGAENQMYNQVHTRSLHAEENAFLQISKNGGIGLKDGKLFTTASCCELCAKKAYQLGIREIYYIDSYPGITENHILKSGKSERRPILKLFSGAVGRAYVSLYNPFLPLKDEIEELTKVNVKETIMNNKKDNNEIKELKDGSNN